MSFLSPKTQSKVVNPRTSAARILHSVLYKGESLSTALINNESSLISDLCYGSLRWYEPISLILNKLLQKPLRKKDKDIECLIHVGLYQLKYQNTPDHAAVAETVSALKGLKKPWAKKLVNAVLRNYLREQDQFEVEIAKTGTAKYAFPQWLIDEIQNAWPDQWESILQKSNERAPMTLRVNLSRITRKEYLQMLQDKNIEATHIDDVPSAIRLNTPCSVHELPGFEKGLVSVQDAAAQMAGFLLGCEPGMTVLDACAAPGGKTGHILESADDLNVLALDNNEVRLERVADNLKRLDYQAELVCADALDIPEYAGDKKFDRILLDAPCSATGVIRRHPDIKVLRRKSDIEALVKLQANMLDALWGILQNDGLLLYATCSILPQENERQIESFLNRHKDIEVQAIENSQGLGRQIFPGINHMDGFYYCLFKKVSP